MDFDLALEVAQKNDAADAATKRAAETATERVAETATDSANETALDCADEIATDLCDAEDNLAALGTCSVWFHTPPTADLEVESLAAWGGCSCWQQSCVLATAHCHHGLCL